MSLEIQSTARGVIYADQPRDLSIWFSRRDLFRRLYVEENKSLKQVKEIVERDYSFPETNLKVYERILRDNLKLRKNLTSQEWAAIRSHLAKRKRDGKQASQIVLDGRVVDPKRVKKEVRRYQNEDNRTLTLPMGISIRSPTPPSVHEATFQEPSLSSQRIQIAIPLTLSPSGQQPQRHACLTPGRSHSELRLNSPHLKFSLLFREFWQPSNAHHPTLQVSSNVDIFYLLERVCFALSNNLDDDPEQTNLKLLLSWIGKDTNVSVLTAFFSLESPVAAAVWDGLILHTCRLREGPAFCVLVDIGLQGKCRCINNSSLSVYLSIAALLGSDLASKAASNLLAHGADPNGPVYNSFEIGDYNRSIQIAASAVDRPMMEMLIQHGSRIDDEYYEGLPKSRYRSRESPLAIVLRNKDDTGSKATRQIECLHLILGANTQLPDYRRYFEDFGDSGSCPGIGRLHEIGWCKDRHHRFLLDDTWKHSRELYHAAAPYSQRVMQSITVPGILDSARISVQSLELYLASRQTHVASNREQHRKLCLEVALSKAAGGGDIQAVKNLLELGTDANTEYFINCSRRENKHRDSKFFTSANLRPVLQAAMVNDTNMLEVLVAHGADINRCETLTAAIQYPVLTRKHATDTRLPTVEFLIKHGIRMDKFGADALDAALEPPRRRRPMKFEPRLAEILLEAGRALNEKLYSQIRNDLLFNLISQDVDLEVIKFLVDRGAEVHSNPDVNGRTMMENAFYDFADYPSRRHSEILTFLLDHDASVDVQMLCRTLGRVLDCNWTTKSRAEFWRQFNILLGLCVIEDESVKQLPLISRLINLSAENSIIEHAVELGFAVEYGNYRKEFAIPLSRNRDDPPLLEAVWAKRFDLAKKLISYGANIHSWCWHDKNDPAYRYSIPGPRTVLEAVCRCGKWVEDEDQARFTEESLEFVEYLLQMGVQVNCSTMEPGMPALHHAALIGRLDIACKLLDHGADVNALALAVPLMTSRRRHGYAPGARALDLAAFEGRVEMIQLLIDCGGRSGILGDTGLDGAIKLATESHHTGVVELLKGYDQRLRSECYGLNDDYLADVEGAWSDDEGSDWGPNMSDEYPYLSQDGGSDCEDLASWWE